MRVKSANCSIGNHDKCIDIKWCQCKCHRGSDL